MNQITPKCTLAMKSRHIADDQDSLETVFVDGIQALKVEGDCLIIELFVLQSTEDDQFGRERAASLKIPITQFGYLSELLARQARKLRKSLQ